MGFYRQPKSAKDFQALSMGLKFYALIIPDGVSKDAQMPSCSDVGIKELERTAAAFLGFANCGSPDSSRSSLSF